VHTDKLVTLVENFTTYAYQKLQSQYAHTKFTS